jgi:hypothetical protein
MDTTSYKGYTIRIEQDSDSGDSPREWDNLGHMACFHNRYNLGDNYKARPDYCNDAHEFLEWLQENEKDIAIILPLYLYDHSGITMWTDDGERRYHQHYSWDGGQVGYIYVMKEEVRKEYSKKHLSKKTLTLARQCLISEVKTFDQFITGDVYGYNIYGPDNPSCADSIDSCWGCYGYEYCLAEAKEAVDYLIKNDQEKSWNNSMIEQGAMAQ